MEEVNNARGDSVTVDSLPANFNEEWVHISDAAALLGYRSERQVWYLIKTHNWEKRQALRKGKWVTFVKREDVMQFYGKREERRRLRELSDKRPVNNQAESIMSKEISRLSSEEMSKAFPVVLGEYKQMLQDFRDDQTHLAKKATKWRMNFLWVGILAVFVCGVLGYAVFNAKQILITKEQVIKKRNAAVKTLSGKISDLSTEIIAASRELAGTQKHLSATQIELSEVRRRLAAAERELWSKDSRSKMLEVTQQEEGFDNLKTNLIEEQE